MYLTPRQNRIMEIAKADGRVLVDDLASAFSVTPQTIRKDLNDLCEGRLLSRIHGGAIFPRGNENMEYESRRSIAASEKAEIGRRTASLIPENASLFINIGTTTEAVGDALVDHRDLMVITNNINVANRLRVFPGIEVVIAGGVVRGTDGGVVGEATVDFIRQFKVDYAIIGASAIDADGALLDYDLREVKVAQAIIANARHVILVADSTKFERAAPVRIAHLSQVQTFVTDVCKPQSLRDICREYEVRLIETGQFEDVIALEPENENAP
ncbi:DeoR/GlpR family DNA-binding transcription regulator [Rhizobium sp. L1K21]|uniref:DeoR/GlpR family DNA-binding transcription regulator n=1 Tax=Rhizobium sp. L1K21 TaxID=2954933 RepID=UPI002092B4BF|nr:DeoR/GlpR family DNA-binding transcription regulator [Rhizobium sp. L1K21]MCO6184910.1 DeoR/GlpR family DNA-binding transcription regulator [Rhizobium sp. L1K21]